MADMGWTDHISAVEASEYGYWGEAIDGGKHLGTVYEESVVFEMRDALIAALPVVKAANRLELDTLVFDMEQAIQKVGMRAYE
jgi:hypothetical protein